MRTIILVCIVALLVACGVAYAVGLVAVTTDNSEGKYIASLIINTAMVRPNAMVTDSAFDEHAATDDFVEVKGKITAVRPDKNEVVVSENVKNWTFRLTKDGRVYLNDRESKLAELQPGDDAVVTFGRQGDQLLASVIRCTRK